MAHYIDKDAVVAEIKRRIKQFVKENNTLLKNSDNAKELRSRIIMCKEVLSFLDTLEVKEVDLEKELKEDWLFADKTEVDCLESMCLTEDMFVSLAKKYFQLGLKAQKGENV